MAQHDIEIQSVPNIPSVGDVAFYPSPEGNFRQVNSDGKNQPISLWTNCITSQQSISAATLTYISGTKLAIPSTKLQVGSRFRWSFSLHKTAAGTASSTYSVVIGTSGDTSDAAILSFVKIAGTAVEDEAWVTIEVIVRSIGGAGVIVGEFTLIHNLLATGHATLPCLAVNQVSSGFDTTVADMFIGVTATTGASDSISVEMAYAEAISL